jgi:hypothetical protein
MLKLQAGDVVRLKKSHPCGSADWEILRTGVDVRLKCRGCGRIILIARDKLRRNMRHITPVKNP